MTEGYTCMPTALTADTQEITVSYNDLTATFGVTVNALLEPSLVVKTAPTKTTYWAGDTLDTEGLVLTYTDAYGEATDVTEGYTCTPTALTADTQTITVSYNDLTATFGVTVNALLEPTLVVKTAPTKTEYLLNDALDTEGLVLTYTDDHGIAVDVTEGFTCTPTALDTAGTQTITVSYNGLTTEFTVNVTEPVVAEPMFTLGSGTAAPGETIDIPITIRDNPGIIGLRVFVSYATDVLTLESVQNCNLFSTGSYTFGNDLAEIPYKLVWEDSLSTINSSDSGDFVVLTFRVKDGAAAGDTPITIVLDEGSIFDADLHLVAFDAVGGTVTVPASEEGGWRFSEDSTLHLHETYNGIQFVTGLDPDDPWVSDYVETTGGWTFDIEMNDRGCESTGAVLNIYNADGDLVESYVIVMFGDADGNSLIDGEDVMLIKDAVYGKGDFNWKNFDETDDYPQTYCSDINHDYTVDGQDVMMLKDCIGFFRPCNQNWNTDTDSLYS